MQVVAGILKAEKSKREKNEKSISIQKWKFKEEQKKFKLENQNWAEVNVCGSGIESYVENRPWIVNENKHDRFVS